MVNERPIISIKSSVQSLVLPNVKSSRVKSFPFPASIWDLKSAHNGTAFKAE